MSISAFAMSQPATVRLFAAFEVPDELRAWAAELPRHLGRRWHNGVRWERPERLHVTVKFLGDLPRDRLPAVAELLTAAAAEAAPMTLTVGEDFGGFPPRGPIKVLWASVAEPTGGLSRLAERLNRAAAAVGVEPEARPYHAHLTLARLTGPFTTADLAELPRTAPTLRSFAVPTAELVLYESVPGEGRYEPISRHRLGSAD